MTSLHSICILLCSRHLHLITSTSLIFPHILQKEWTCSFSRFFQLVLSEDEILLSESRSIKTSCQAAVTVRALQASRSGKMLTLELPYRLTEPPFCLHPLWLWSNTQSLGTLKVNLTLQWCRWLERTVTKNCHFWFVTINSIICDGNKCTDGV